MAAAEAEVYSADVFCFAGHGVPFGIIFGGTDLNEDVNDGEKHQAMGRVLQEARYYDPRASQALDARPFWMQVCGNRETEEARHAGGSHLTTEAHFLLSIRFVFISLSRFLFCRG